MASGPPAAQSNANAWITSSENLLRAPIGLPAGFPLSPGFHGLNPLFPLCSFTASFVLDCLTHIVPFMFLICLTCLTLGGAGVWQPWQLICLTTTP